MAKHSTRAPSGPAAQVHDAQKPTPTGADHHLRLGMSLWASGKVAEAGEHLRTATELAPDHAAAHEALGQWCYEAADLEPALRHSEAALRLAPRDPAVMVSRAVVLVGAGRAEEAWRLVEPLLQGQTTDARLGMVLGRIAPAVKREAEALAYVTRALAQGGADEARLAPLRFSAAALLDRVGRFDEAFEQARLAKAATRRPYDARQTVLRVDRLISFFTPAELESLPRATHGSRRPVFVVGMPRSGTSLVEQVLASHPQVFGAGELAAASRIVNAAAGAAWAEDHAYPNYLHSVSVRRANQLAQEYLSVIAGMNADATYVTDKMPANFFYLGDLGVLFPECHVVHCKRNPLDTCLSCFMTHFANGHEFSHDLRDLAGYYHQYRRLMTHWTSVLDVPFIEVHYEDMVLDLEGQARRLLDFLGLPWDDRCLTFHQTARAVATASNAQVRRPIYTSSLDRWKHYVSHLVDLVAEINP